MAFLSRRRDHGVDNGDRVDAVIGRAESLSTELQVVVADLVGLLQAYKAKADVDGDE